MNGTTVVLNAAKMNYDGKLDLTSLAPHVTIYDDSTPEQMI